MIAVIGGKLQGVEAVYLARKAGHPTLVIDKNPQAPAVGLCDRFMAFEFTPATPTPPDCPDIELILPAIEDEEVLSLIDAWARGRDIPIAFDLAAYGISTSKRTSDALFQKMKLPAPTPWPLCAFPVVVKPDQSSGSHGVEIFQTPDALKARFPDPEERQHLVIQTFLQGPSFSIEVMGRNGHYTALQVTDLFMDDIYDCRKVTAPTRLSPDKAKALKEMGITIARGINLTGLMDVEVILHEEELKLLEIDARLPSQTPMAVYGSTGVNMVQALYDLFTRPPSPVVLPQVPETERPALVEHIRVAQGKMTFAGEHIMAMDGPPDPANKLFPCRRGRDQLHPPP